MPQKGFYFDMNYCIGCKVCQIACKDKNQLEVGTSYREVTTYEGGRFPKPKVSYFTMACNHCGTPKCLASCPVGAITKRKEDGIVVINQDICTGCKRCVEECPFNGVKYLGEEINKVGKCNLCLELTKKGEEPACVAGCLMRVLKQGDFQELMKEYGDKNTVNPIDRFNTKPSYIVKPKR